MNGVTPAGLVFWSGAGISADLPTGGPLGRTLTDRALDAYTRPGMRAELDALYADLEAPNRALRPRLETVLEALVSVYGTEVLDDVLSDLVNATPNRHHEAFAHHVLSGGHHVTANFDTCIERARPDVPRASVIHIHGSLEEDSSALGARLSVIQGGFPQPLLDRLDRLLGDPNIKTLAFVGYSGSDFFDATPYLLHKLAKRQDLQVLWLDFKDQPVAACGDSAISVVGQLHAAGVRVQCFRGRLDDFLHMLLPDARTGTRSAAGPVRGWRPRQVPMQAQREAASLRLLVQIGYRKETLRLLTQQVPQGPQEWQWLAEAQWSAGRYRQALVSWRQSFDSEMDEDRARLAEREAATLWIRGSLTRAERACWRSIRQWCRPSSQVSALSQSRLLEMYGRITTHMRRWPDLRMLVRRSRVQIAALRLAQLQPALFSGDLQSRIVTANALAAMVGRSDDELASHIEVFQESESLMAWLNYLHADLRASATCASRADLLLMAARFERLGAHGDAPRTLLLPGVQEFFSGWDVFQAFSGVDITVWQRMRFAAGVQARRSLSQIRKAPTPEAAPGRQRPP